MMIRFATKLKKKKMNLIIFENDNERPGYQYGVDVPDIRSKARDHNAKYGSHNQKLQWNFEGPCCLLDK